MVENSSAEPSQNLIFPQSGVIPYRFEAEGLKVMLITSLRRKRWIIPKGIIEEDMNATESAQAEAFEEAGIKGKIYPEVIGEYQREKWGGVCKIKVFLLEVDRVFDEWPESSLRDRKWLSPEEAEKLVTDPNLKKMLTNLTSYIENAKSV